MSVQNKFNVGDKVILVDQEYAKGFFPNYKGEELIVVNIEEDAYANDLLVTDAGISAFDYRFTLVESAQESIEKPAETPSNQGKTCSQNCVSCKDKETPFLEYNDENAWFKRNEFPPAGTVCEVMDGGEWLQTVVVGVDSEGFAVYESTWIDIPYDGENNPLRFRPIKTAEEVAAEERATYCDRIYGVLCKAERKNNRSDMAEALYDAGLRFAEKGE